MKTYFNFFLLFILLILYTSCNKKETIRLPEIESSVTWKFTSATVNSGLWWSIPTPNKWDMDIKIINRDQSPLVIVPDFLFMEVFQKDAIAKGLHDKIMADKRKIYMPYSVDKAPDDTSGKVTRTIVFPAEDDLYTVIWTDAFLHWKHNMNETEWKSMNLLNNDSLICHWQDLNNYTYSMDYKVKPDYHLYLLGPVIYDSSQTNGNAFLLVSEPDTCINSGVEWISFKSALLPLTEEKIVDQISDTAKPVEWRCHFIAMLWDQPRPVKNAGTILTQLFTEKNNPDALQFSAAFSLIETGNKPMLDSLKRFILNDKNNLDNRADLLSHLYKLEENDFSFYKDIANNKSYAPKLRHAATLALKNTKDSLFVTPELKNEIDRYLEAEEYCRNGNKYLMDKMYSKSIVEYTKALNIIPDYDDALNGRGGAYFNLKQYDKAMVDFTKDIQLKPTNSSLNLRGMCYYKKKQYDRAVSDFQKAIEIDPTVPEPYSNLGLYYIFEGDDHSKGCKYLKKACELGNCSQYETALQQATCSE